MAGRATTEEVIRAVVGPANAFVGEKQLDHVDVHARAFIALSPMVIVATADADGRCDSSPRGDPPGFVHVVDPRTLVLPDRKGNRRVDTMRNIAANPSAGLLFLVPGRPETLRVNGPASIVTDTELLEPCAVDGKVPPIGICIGVEEVYFHCARSFLRGGIWEPERWPDASGLPSLGAIYRDQAKMAATAREVDDALDAANRDLY